MSIPIFANGMIEVTSFNDPEKKFYIKKSEITMMGFSESNYSIKGIICSVGGLEIPEKEGLCILHEDYKPQKKGAKLGKTNTNKRSTNDE